MDHRFFEYGIARQLWCFFTKILGEMLEMSFLSIEQMWLRSLKYAVSNKFCATTLWGFGN
jgi:hypothetical protein